MITFFGIFFVQGVGDQKHKERNTFFVLLTVTFNMNLFKWTWTSLTFVNNFYGLWFFCEPYTRLYDISLAYTCIYYVHDFSSEIFAIFWSDLKFYVQRKSLRNKKLRLLCFVTWVPYPLFIRVGMFTLLKGLVYKFEGKMNHAESCRVLILFQLFLSLLLFFFWGRGCSNPSGFHES